MKLQLLRDANIICHDQSSTLLPWYGPSVSGLLPDVCLELIPSGPDIYRYVYEWVCFYDGLVPMFPTHDWGLEPAPCLLINLGQSLSNTLQIVMSNDALWFVLLSLYRLNSQMQCAPKPVYPSQDQPVRTDVSRWLTCVQDYPWASAWLISLDHAQASALQPMETHPSLLNKKRMSSPVMTNDNNSPRVIFPHIQHGVYANFSH